jgi:beta-xylosidase
MEIDGEVMKLEIKGIENDKENFGGYYGEGPWVFKRNNLYYLMYSNGWGEKSTLVYAIAKNPLGPFEFVGEVMDPVDSFTSHGSIIEFNNKWYIFYHNMSLSKNNYRRSICFDEINFDQDGKIIKLKLQN